MGSTKTADHNEIKKVRRAYDAMLVSCGTGAAAVFGTMLWVKSKTASTMSGFGHHIGSTDVIGHTAKIGNDYLNATGFELCNADKGVANHVTIEVIGNHIPNSIANVCTSTPIPVNNYVQAFIGDKFILGGFSVTLNGVHEVVNKAANTDTLYAVLQYVPQSVLAEAHILEAIGVGLAVGGFLGIMSTFISDLRR